MSQKIKKKLHKKLPLDWHLTKCFLEGFVPILSHCICDAHSTNLLRKNFIDWVLTIWHWNKYLLRLCFYSHWMHKGEWHGLKVTSLPATPEVCNSCPALGALNNFLQGKICLQKNEKNKECLCSKKNFKSQAFSIWLFFHAGA